MAGKKSAVRVEDIKPKPKEGLLQAQKKDKSKSLSYEIPKTPIDIVRPKKAGILQTQTVKTGGIQPPKTPKPPIKYKLPNQVTSFDNVNDYTYYYD